jgi:hypothetical protein
MGRLLLMDIKVSWTRLKTFIDAGFPYDKEAFNNDYCVYVNDGAIIRYTIITGSDKTEYDNAYDGGEFSSKKYYAETKTEVFAPTLDDVMGLYPKKKMFKHTATAGQLNIFDIEVDLEKRICGGEYWIKDSSVSNVHEDDYIEFSVIDKDDVLGLFESLNLEVGVDVLEISKYVITDYIKKGCSSVCYHSQLWEGIKGTTKCLPGLFFRVQYDSNGTSNIDFMWRLYYYE